MVGAIHWLKGHAFLALWPAGIVLLVEFLSRGSLGETLLWSVRNLCLFVLNDLLVFCLLALVWAVTGLPRAAYWLVASVGVALGFTSGTTLRLMGRPLVPWDLLLAGEAHGVIYLPDLIHWPVIIGLLLFTLISGLLVHRPGWLPPVKANGRERAAFGTIALGLGALILFDRPIPVNQLFRAQNLTWDQSANVRKNGLALSMVGNLRQGWGVPLASVGAAVPVLAGQAAPPLAPSGSRPNVIVVLSESFWDPTRMTSLTFSRDPIPFFHSLQEQYPSGYMLSPEFAGSTANVELEVLTGLSMRFLPHGVVAYERYINRPVDSLAAILRRQGYAATVVSPWSRWFFNAQAVYRDFGFSRFISQEFINPVISGEFLADAEVARVITAETERTPGPDFVFANTAENHYGYYKEKFKGPPEIQVSGVADDAREPIESYAQGCLHADNMLRTLVEHYAQAKEPTVIAFFGDHLPLLGKEFLAYRASHYITGTTDADFLEKMYRVPVVVWNNFRPAHKESIDFGTTFLGPYLLEQAGVPGTPVTDYLRELSRRLPAVPPQDSWARLGLPERDLQAYQALQQDILFGEQSAYGPLKGQIVDPDFQLGYGPLLVDRVESGDGEDGATVTVSGRNFPPTAVITVNGKPLTTVSLGPGSLSATVPRYLNRPWALRVAVPDTEGRTMVAQSELTAIP